MKHIFEEEGNGLLIAIFVILIFASMPRHHDMKKINDNLQILHGIDYGECMKRAAWYKKPAVDFDCVNRLKKENENE